MNASVESLVLIKYYDKLQTMIQGEIVSMSTKALSKHLLSSGEHSKCIHMIYTNEQKAMFFMQAIRNRVDIDSAYFGTFLGVLKQEPSYEFMTDKLGMFKHNYNITIDTNLCTVYSGLISSGPNFRCFRGLIKASLRPYGT